MIRTCVDQSVVLQVSVSFSHTGYCMFVCLSLSHTHTLSTETASPFGVLSLSLSHERTYKYVMNTHTKTATPVLCRRWGRGKGH